MLIPAIILILMIGLFPVAVAIGVRLAQKYGGQKSE